MRVTLSEEAVGFANAWSVKRDSEELDAESVLRYFPDALSLQ